MRSTERNAKENKSPNYILKAHITFVKLVLWKVIENETWLGTSEIESYATQREHTLRRIVG